MKNNKENVDVRQMSLKWWKELSEMHIFKLTGKYGFTRRNREALTNKEVQRIYECEHSD